MRAGYLSEYFSGVAAKVLSGVEADTYRSNQHEFNGVGDLKRLFGLEKHTYQAKFLYLNDTDDEPPTDEGYLTWYDARENHPTRSEYRLYFPGTSVTTCAEAGDLLVIGLRDDNTALVIIAEQGSTISNQIKWLFGFDNTFHPGFSVREELESDQDRIAFASRVILEQIGVAVEVEEDNFLDGMLERFGASFPNTRDFSDYARSTLYDVTATEDPDVALMSWLEREEILFRTLERHIIAERLSVGFHDDVDSFIAFSLSVQNRRKSRAGYSLENHLQHMFNTHNILYSRGAMTENRSKPDFVFPGISMYHDNNFNILLLTMLGVKTSCKDRWRQVLAEADRISNKHIVTLEPAISEAQTNEMNVRNLQLVLPRSLHQTYTVQQQRTIIDINDFLDIVKDKQRRAGF